MRLRDVFQCYPAGELSIKKITAFFKLKCSFKGIVSQDCITSNIDIAGKYLFFILKPYSYSRLYLCHLPRSKTLLPVQPKH
jgi:hypothetical protein